ncbi:MAG: isoprenylcysteine carboxylmethyltransferase family protein [Candidatus Omnitrophota bacterium]|nr:isoprenylcysteine carboxylmethyltransferase family protein [Candidatus Omnitrophota bacterium]
MKKRLKIDGFLSVILAIVLIYLARLFYRPKGKILDYALDIIGIIVVVFGQILRISGRNYKKQHSGQGSALITDGPYSLVRNPMYLGTFLMGVGFVTILWPWWFLLIFAGIFYLRFKNLILSEESKLSEIFGKSYKEYKQSVPCFFLSIARLVQLPKYLPLKWKWLKKELPVILAWFLLVAIIKGLVEKMDFFSREYLAELAVLSIALIATFGFFSPILIRDGPKQKS